MKTIPSKRSDEVLRHWLLNLAVESHVRLVRLFPEVEEEGLNARKIPGCKAYDYVEGLQQLFDLGMIRFTSESLRDQVETRSSVTQVLERLLKLADDKSIPSNKWMKSHERYRTPGMQVDFKLTEEGGAAWEETAEPNWGRFISVGTYGATGSQSEAGELISADRDLVVAYMGWYPEVNGEQIPSFLPFLLALHNPARTRSLISEASNSAIAAMI
jgi:hypothetical protein